MNAWESNNLHQITTNMSLDQLISAMLCSCYIPKGSLVKWHADAFTTNGGKLFTGFSLLFTSLLKNKNFWKSKMTCSSVREIEKYTRTIAKKLQIFLSLLKWDMRKIVKLQLSHAAFYGEPFLFVFHLINSSS